MKIALISDVHGKRKQLKQVLEQIAAHQPDHIYCLGDMVECKISKANLHSFQFAFVDQVLESDPKLVKRLRHISCISGNQEERIRSLIPLYQVEEDMRYFITQPPVIELPSARLEHGHQFLNEKNWYPYPRQMSKRILFYGHTHESGLFQLRWAGKKWSPEKNQFEFGTPISLDMTKHWAVNVGAIASEQPEWVLYQEDVQQITFFRSQVPATN